MAAADLVEGLRLTPLVAPSSQQIVFSQLRAVWTLPGGAHTMYIPNPAPQPSSMVRSQLSELMRPDAPRLATLKANGTRFQLMMTLNAARAPIACFANRKLDLYDVRVRARADFYNGTVLDGELLQLPTPAKAVNGGAPVVAVFLDDRPALPRPLRARDPDGGRDCLDHARPAHRVEAGAPDRGRSAVVPHGARRQRRVQGGRAGLAA